jgi:signal transduction histidine kinase
MEESSQSVDADVLGSTSSSPGSDADDFNGKSLVADAGDGAPKGLEQHLFEAAHLYHIGVALTGAQDLAHLGKILQRELKRLIVTTNFALAVYESTSGNITLPLIIHQSQELGPFSIRLDNEQGPLAEVIRVGEPLLIRDWATETQGRSPLWGSTQPRSWLGLPLVWHQNVLGAMVIQDERPGVLTAHHQMLLSAVAKQVAPVLWGIQANQEIHRRAIRLAILEEVGLAFAATLDLEEVLTRIMERINVMLEVSAGSLLLVEEETGDLIFQIALGEKAEEIKPFRLKKGQGIAGQVALTGESVLIADVQHDQRHFKQTDVTTGFLTKSMICVPLVTRGQVIGVVQVLNKINGEFSTDDLELLEAISNYAAIALENAMLHRNVRAERDRVIIAQEEVRRQLARDLHDGPTQLVASMLMSIDFSRQALEKHKLELIGKELVDMNELGQRATHQMRTLLFELRPLVLETQGLVTALEVFLERRQKDEKTELQLEIEADRPGGKFARPSSKVEAALFAIAQEAVNNALKHAQAEYIRVRLIERDGGLAMIVEDDGQGFDLKGVMSNYEQRGSLGMVNVQERAEQIGGQFVMNTRAGRGTKVTVWVPDMGVT